MAELNSGSEMSDYNLTTPLSESDVRKLAVGDSVTLNGTIFGVRDATLIRIVDQKVAPPVDWHGAALLHTAPNVRKVNGKYQPVSVGTTTSMRMDRFTEGLLRDYGVRAILGKVRKQWLITARVICRSPEALRRSKRCR